MPPSRLLDEAAMAQTLERMGAEIVEKCKGGEAPVLAGIQRRGAFLADPLAAILSRALAPLGRGSPISPPIATIPRRSAPGRSWARPASRGTSPARPASSSTMSYIQ